MLGVCTCRLMLSLCDQSAVVSCVCVLVAGCSFYIAGLGQIVFLLYLVAMKCDVSGTDVAPHGGFCKPLYPGSCSCAQHFLL